MKQLSKERIILLESYLTQELSGLNLFNDKYRLINSVEVSEDGGKNFPVVIDVQYNPDVTVEKLRKKLEYNNIQGYGKLISIPLYVDYEGSIADIDEKEMFDGVEVFYYRRSKKLIYDGAFHKLMKLKVRITDILENSENYKHEYYSEQLEGILSRDKEKIEKFIHDYYINDVFSEKNLSINSVIIELNTYIRIAFTMSDNSFYEFDYSVEGRHFNMDVDVLHLNPKELWDLFYGYLENNLIL
jgi:hypothetical protein